MRLSQKNAKLTGIGVLVAGALIGAGVWATSFLVEQAVERDAARRSIEWSQYAAENLARIDAIAAGAPLDAEQMQVVERMAEFGGVFRFKIFSPEGHLRFVSDDPEAASGSLGAHNPIAAGVVQEGAAYTVVADGTGKANRPDLYSETYLPITDANGHVLAIAETYLDQTEKTQSVRKEYFLFGSIMVGLIVMALTGPSLALLAMFRRLRARNIELDAERVRAQEADRAKTQFLATISHELRTPMNGIIGAVQLLELSDLDEDDVDNLEILKTCSESQMALIEELLTFGALEAGKMRLEEDVLELAPALKTATGFATIAADGKGIAFNVVVNEDAPAFETDAKRLQQIVVNLVGNAIKFTETGSVEVRANLERGDDDQSCSLRIAVKDTGPGIPISEQSRIFERFTQVDETSTRKAGGTGLGLAIARTIARAMGGDITVESTPGEGAMFVLEIPVSILAQPQTSEGKGRIAA